MHCRAIEHTAVFQSKAGEVKRTPNAVTNQFAFRERAAKVGAGFCHRKDSVSATDQQDGHMVVHSPGWSVMGQLRFRQDGNKLFGKCLAVGPIDSDSVIVDQLST